MIKKCLLKCNISKYISSSGLLEILSIFLSMLIKNIYFTNGDKVYLERKKYQNFVKHYMQFLRKAGV